MEKIEILQANGDGGSSDPAREAIELLPVEENVVPYNRTQSNLTSATYRSMSVGRRMTVGAKKILSGEETDKRKTIMMKERRLSHLNKFSGGRIKTDRHQKLRQVSSCPLSDAPLREHRDAAAVLLWKAGVQKLSSRPIFQTSSEMYGGRSFLTSDLKNGDDDVEVDDVLLTDFFNFEDINTKRDELVDTEEEEITAAGPLFDAFKAILKKGRKELTLKPRQKKKTWFFLGNLLRRKMKKGMNDKLKHHFDDRREYFTVWLSFVQTIIMIVVLCIYPFAPIGIDVKEVRKEVFLSREGVTYKENLQTKIIESFWLGPSLENLIVLGAKYSPCMRKDNKVFAEIQKERQAENNTGCCMSLLSNGCIQRPEKDCMTPSVEFAERTVCGQDPDVCLVPPGTEWDRSTITSWPQCVKAASKEKLDKLKHTACQVVGRPCCMKTQGQCVITTPDNCKFMRGRYHSQHTLCSQVDCLASTCGNNFFNDDKPDQFYRLFVSLFLCAGILHLVVVLIFNFTVLKDIEGYAGWFRTSLMFILTGAGGNLWSAILVPYQAEVGESGAMFGIFACIFVEGIQNWSNLEQPWRYIGKLVVILFVLFLFGLLPMVDNFAHIFGFIYGLLLGFVLLPTIVTKDKDVDPFGHKREVRKNLVISVVSLVLAILLTVLGIVLFYYEQDFQTEAIGFFNCPFGEKFCRNFHQGQEIEPREIEY